MTPFEYIRAESIEEAVAAGARPGAAYLAGGTNLLDLMKAGVAHPQTLVDITRLNDLYRVDQQADGSLRVGALVANADLARDPRITRFYPAVAEALLSGASPQLRNAASLAGNLVQRTRCPYFYDPHSACNQRMAGAGCAALGGETHGHAVLGWTKACIATHPSDFAVPLVALDAQIECTGPEGTRSVPLETLYRLPTDDTAPQTVLAPGELITALRLPEGGARFADRARYLKLRDRTSYAFALVSVAAMLEIEDGQIVEARIALGGVAAKPWRSHDAEEALKGIVPSEDAFRMAGDVALTGAHPSGDNAAKIELARRLVMRALRAAMAGTPERMPALPGSVFSVDAGEMIP